MTPKLQFHDCILVFYPIRYADRISESVSVCGRWYVSIQKFTYFLNTTFFISFFWLYAAFGLFALYIINYVRITLLVLLTVFSNSFRLCLWWFDRVSEAVWKKRLSMLLSTPLWGTSFGSFAALVPYWLGSGTVTKIELNWPRLLSFKFSD